MPSYARFTTMDPLCEKYYSISPYVYCADNPVNWVDPQGEDVAVLHAVGHMAMLIQNNKGTWSYYSINGDNFYIGNKHMGGRPFNDLGESSFNSPEDFLNSDFNVD